MQRLKIYLIGLVVLFTVGALCTAGFLNYQSATIISQTGLIPESALREPISFPVLVNPAFYDESIISDFGTRSTAGGNSNYNGPEPTEGNAMHCNCRI